MTSSLPLLAAAPLVAGLLSAPTTGVTATWQTAAEPGRRAVNIPAHPLTAKVAASGMPDVVEHRTAPTASERKRVLGYWTPRRMASALPVDRLSKATGFLGRLFARAGRGVTPTGARTAPPHAPPAPAGPPAGWSNAPRGGCS